MDSNKEVVYTKAAEEKMEEAVDRYQRMLERFVRDEKFVPGDEVLEITASDVQRASRQVRLISSRGSTQENILKLYASFGAIIALIGLFYETFQRLLTDSPIKLALVSSGLIVSLTSAFLLQIYRRRRLEAEREQERMERFGWHDDNLS